MIILVAMKKAPLNPSGPEELFCLREKTATLISSDEGVEVRKKLSEAKTLGLLTWKRVGLGWQAFGLKRFEKKPTAWALMIAGSSVVLPLTKIWWIELKELMALADR
ncbi:hypothetical protein AAC387_Pa04g0854 [Persea americana]